MLHKLLKQRSRVDLGNDSGDGTHAHGTPGSTSSSAERDLPPIPLQSPVSTLPPYPEEAERASIPTSRSSSTEPLLQLGEAEGSHPAPSIPAVVLNWTPGELDEPNHEIEQQREAMRRMENAAAQSTDDQALSSAAPGVDEDQMPPRYEEARFPTTPIKYTFSPSSPFSMLLIPPLSHPDSRPLYHISVHPNYWIPSSWITKIVRGGTQDGEEVGEFEMGVSVRAPTVCMRKKEHLLSSILTVDRSKKVDYVRKTIYHWRFLIARVYWEYSWEDSSKTVNECKLHSDNTLLARYQHFSDLRAIGQPPLLSTLEVLPAGFKYLDDIIVSILAVERKRLTPESHTK